VLMEFAGDITATFTMTAFTQTCERQLRVHGTAGEIAMRGETVTLRTFADRNTETIVLGDEPGGHGGGDSRVVQSWLQAITSGDPSQILTSAQESLRTHAIAFAAERARREGRIVEMDEMYSEDGVFCCAP